MLRPSKLMLLIGQVVKLVITYVENFKTDRGCRGCDRMVFGFTTTYAISAYHH